MFKEIPRLLWNLKSHYHTQNNPPRDPNLSQRSPIYALKTCASKIHYSICPCKPRSPKHLFPSGFPTEIPCVFLSLMVVTFSVSCHPADFAPHLRCTNVFWNRSPSFLVPSSNSFPVSIYGLNWRVEIHLRGSESDQILDLLGQGGTCHRYSRIMKEWEGVGMWKGIWCLHKR